MPTTIIPPPPPYTYDDPRFVYDESCMLYDGGFDLVCLTNITTLPKRLGRSSSSKTSTLRTAYEEQCETIIKLMITTSLEVVNGKQITYKEIEKKYYLRYKPITVSVEDIKTATNEYNISMDKIISTITVPKICVNPSVKLLPISTIVSSSLENRVRKQRILVSKIFSNKKDK